MKTTTLLKLPNGFEVKHRKYRQATVPAGRYGHLDEAHCTGFFRDTKINENVFWYSDGTKDFGQIVHEILDNNGMLLAKTITPYKAGEI